MTTGAVTDGCAQSARDLAGALRLAQGLAVQVEGTAAEGTARALVKLLERALGQAEAAAGAESKAG